mmetsp:Transcript_1676/g.2732  ORF Transcript_1676/g.2732 Transcript_1676/m.2732 type:complete len:279 (-) Transcript_1676:9-845(-)
MTAILLVDKVGSVDSTHRVPPELFRQQVAVARVCAVVIVLMCSYYVEEINVFIEVVWGRYLRTNALFKHDSFEPLLSTFTFGVVMFVWVMIDFYLPWFHRYRISNSDDISTWKGREKAFWNETFWYISPWLVIDFFIPRRKLPTEVPTFPQIVWQIGLALFMFDLFFFMGHYCFHHNAFLYKHVHATHHHSPIIRATDTIRHTVWDGSWDVLCSVLALNTTRAHPLSRAIYNIVAISLITEAHSGMNFPWALHNLLPAQVMAGPIVHDTHHRLLPVDF